MVAGSSPAGVAILALRRETRLHSGRSPEQDVIGTTQFFIPVGSKAVLSLRFRNLPRAYAMSRMDRCISGLTACGLPALAVALLLLSSQAQAETLLRIERGDAPALELDRAALEQLPRHSFSTSTQWTAGALEFTGVPLRDLLSLADITTGTIRAVALNDYAVSMIVDDLGESVPIVAYLINGEPFSRREKGPLWIVYPYDSGAEYRTEVAYGTSVWQLVRLVAE